MPEGASVDMKGFDEMQHPLSEMLMRTHRRTWSRMTATRLEITVHSLRF